MSKKRLLMVTEASYLSTGYAVYSDKLLNYLHNSGKYEVGEVCCYGCPPCPRDSRILSLPWKAYPVAPADGNQDEFNLYESVPENQFGLHKFEPACLDFQPDIVFDIRDHWMFSFEGLSPFRRLYNWTICPTVDSYPQNVDWISSFTEADAVFTYTDFSYEVLKKEGGGKIKLQSSVPAGVDLDVFKPVQNKVEHKRMFGMKDDTLIIGTVNRNQKRKLYPDLFQAFAEFLKTSPQLAQRTYLYCHTSFPDLGYDIPYFLKKFGVANKVLFTYCCFKCGAVYPAIYQDVRTICPKCKSQDVTFPNTSRGIDRNSLAEIYKLFDVYVQYAIAEGEGIGQVEAAACGIPVMSVDYSGMADVVRKVNGYPIKVQRMFYESETNCERALPDNDDLVNKLTNFLQLPESMRMKKGFDARNGAEKHYNWDGICKKWDTYFDSVEVPSHEQTWKRTPFIFSPTKQIPNEQQLNDEQFVNWALVNVLGRPDKVGSYFSLKLLRDLTWKATNMNMQSFVFNDYSMLGNKPTIVPFDRNKLVELLIRQVEKNNFWEQQRWEKVLKGEIR